MRAIAMAIRRNIWFEKLLTITWQCDRYAGPLWLSAWVCHEWRTLHAVWSTGAVRIPHIPCTATLAKIICQKLQRVHVLYIHLHSSKSTAKNKTNKQTNKQINERYEVIKLCDVFLWHTRRMYRIGRLSLLPSVRCRRPRHGYGMIGVVMHSH